MIPYLLIHYKIDTIEKLQYLLKLWWFSLSTALIYLSPIILVLYKPNHSKEAKL